MAAARAMSAAMKSKRKRVNEVIDTKSGGHGGHGGHGGRVGHTHELCSFNKTGT